MNNSHDPDRIQTMRSRHLCHDSATARRIILAGWLLMLVPLAAAPAGATGIRFYGDLQLSRGIDRFVLEQGAAPVREALAPFLARDAVHVVNLEGAVGDACAPGRAPCFPIRPAMLDILDGFDVVSLENNHAMDTGPAGVQRTVAGLGQRAIAPLVGQQFSATVETGEGAFSIIAATDVVNAASDRKGTMAADAPEVLAEIRRLKHTSGVVAVYVHWGRELIAAPTERMRELARRYAAAGADVIVGTHPHVPGGAACIEGKPVVWSVGNFLFDQKYDATKKGALLDCDLKGGHLSCSLSGHETPRNSYLPVQSAEARYAADNALLAACTPAVTPTWTGVFGRDRREKRLLRVPEDAQGTMSHLELYDLKSGRRELRTPAMPIRRVQPVDLNGDGIRELLLIQEIYSSLDREVAKRVYLYSCDSSFRALWRGSALSRPLLDALFVAGRKGRPELVALHSDETFLKRNPVTVKRTVMRYRWNGFGFAGTGEREAPAGSQVLRAANGMVRFCRREQRDIIARTTR